MQRRSCLHWLTLISMCEERLSRASSSSSHGAMLVTLQRNISENERKKKHGGLGAAIGRVLRDKLCSRVPHLGGLAFRDA